MDIEQQIRTYFRLGFITYYRATCYPPGNMSMVTCAYLGTRSTFESSSKGDTVDRAVIELVDNALKLDRHKAPAKLAKWTQQGRLIPEVVKEQEQDGRWIRTMKFSIDSIKIILKETIVSKDDSSDPIHQRAVEVVKTVTDPIFRLNERGISHLRVLELFEDKIITSIIFRYNDCDQVYDISGPLLSAETLEMFQAVIEGCSLAASSSDETPSRLLVRLTPPAADPRLYLRVDQTIAPGIYRVGAIVGPWVPVFGPDQIWTLEGMAEIGLDLVIPLGPYHTRPWERAAEQLQRLTRGLDRFVFVTKNRRPDNPAIVAYRKAVAGVYERELEKRK